MASADLKVIFSIDLGTWGFQVAHASVGNVTNAQLVAEWIGHERLDGKVLSAILLNGTDKSIMEFAWEARNRYLSAKEENDDDLKEMAYFENFKLQLLQQKALSFDAGKEITSSNPEFRCALGPLITKCLRRIKDHSLDYYRKRIARVEDSECFWILTVPVSWTEQSREVMKLCCEQVDIPRENVLIVTEPEAAGNYFIWGTESGREKREGFKFVVLDCGSGTFDLVAKEIVDVDGSRQLRDIHEPNGDLFGALNVDDAFFDVILTHVFGERVVERFKNEWPVDYVEQRKWFQNVRVRVKRNDREKSVVLAGALIDLAEEHKIDYTENARSFAVDGETGILSVARKGFKLHLNIPQPVWLLLHTPVVEKIVQTTHDMLEDIDDDVDLLFLVGGFSQSDFVRKRITEMVEDDLDDSVNVLPCDRAQVAVPLGALWAAEQKVVSRKLPVSYGLAFEQEYNPMIPEHEERKVPDVNSRNGYKIPGCFKCLWVKGDDVKAGSTLKRQFPLHPGQTDVKIEMYQSKDDVTHYIDEETCRDSATWTYQLDPGLVSAQEQTLCVQFDFGDDCIFCGLYVRNAEGVDSRVRKFMMKLDCKFEE